MVGGPELFAPPHEHAKPDRNCATTGIIEGALHCFAFGIEPEYVRPTGFDVLEPTAAACRRGER